MKLWHTVLDRPTEFYEARSVHKIMEMFVNMITSGHRCLWRDYSLHTNCGRRVYFQENEKVCGYVES